MKNNLAFYHIMSKIKRPSSYEGKLMLIAFAGTHIPLLGLIFYVIVAHTESLNDSLPYIITTLVATLFGMIATLSGLHLMLQPVTAVSKTLRAYLDEKELPHLPTEYTDQAGHLMADVQHVITSLDSFIIHYKHHASTDMMTGLPNRSAAEQFLISTIKQAQEQKQSFSFCFIDVNDFKTLNDTYSHEFGDVVLIKIGEILTQSIRGSDFCARWGGDEFILILVDSDHEKNSLFTRIENAFSETTFSPKKGESLFVSISCGVATYNTEESFEQLIKHADSAMYSAKKMNSTHHVRVMFHTD